MISRTPEGINQNAARIDCVPSGETVQPTRPHKLAEDGYAMLIASSFIAFGVILLNQAGLITGGMAGLALLISHFMSLSPTSLFLVINLPFFWFAARAVNVSFGLKTLVANLAIMGVGMLIPHVIGIKAVNPVFAALFAGSLIGIGVLALARHGAGVGGLGVITLMLQQSKGWNAGRSQMIGDLVILTSSLAFLSSRQFALSVLSAVTINAVMMVNHRPGRYLA